MLGQLDRALDGFCTGVGEVNLVAAAHQTDNALRKSGLLLVVEQIVAAVHHLMMYRTEAAGCLISAENC